jgi:hypothetical protein
MDFFQKSLAKMESDNYEIKQQQAANQQRNNNNSTATRSEETDLKNRTYKDFERLILNENILLNLMNTEYKFVPQYIR